jgi:hypothetical protein
VSVPLRSKLVLLPPQTIARAETRVVFGSAFDLVNFADYERNSGETRLSKCQQTGRVEHFMDEIKKGASEDTPFSEENDLLGSP